MHHCTYTGEFLFGQSNIFFFYPLPPSLNSTAGTLSANYWGLSLVFLPVFTALGNILVILSVTQVRGNSQMTSAERGRGDAVRRGCVIFSTIDWFKMPTMGG